MSACRCLGLPSIHCAFVRQRNRAKAYLGLRGKKPKDIRISLTNLMGNKRAFQNEKAICPRNVLSLPLSQDTQGHHSAESNI